MKISFTLSQTDSRPMYLQIMGEIQQRVSVGDWAPGTRLPSIREMAVALKVSVITVKRAYLELERAGVIVTQHGKGSWVADTDNADALRRKELARHVEIVVQLARDLGMDDADLIEVMEEALRGGR